MFTNAENAKALLNSLFPHGHSVRFEDVLFLGKGQCGETPVAVIGSINHVLIGAELALRLAAETLNVVRDHPRRPILLMIDTQGHRLSFRDELLGLNGYMAHLIRCLDLARRRGHRIIGFVWSQAVSAGLLATSLLADACHALPEAEIKVMNLPAMARITKQPLELLVGLSETSAVFAPGVENFHRMGAVREIWRGDLSQRLAEALAAPPREDDRRRSGEVRAGRTHAHLVSERVRRDDLR
jgi:malonate decarboxylase gamma subunit